MYETTTNHKGFEYLESASKRVDSWPSWKKELAGIDVRKENPAQNETTNVVSCSSSKRDNRD